MTLENKWGSITQETGTTRFFCQKKKCSENEHLVNTRDELLENTKDLIFELCFKIIVEVHLILYSTELSMLELKGFLLGLLKFWKQHDNNTWDTLISTLKRLYNRKVFITRGWTVFCCFFNCSHPRGHVTYGCFKYYISSSARLQQMPVDVRQIFKEWKTGTSSIRSVW